MLVFTLAFSTTAFAGVYGIENMPHELQTVPQQEQELSIEVKEEILQKLLESEYLDSNAEDIVIRCYGTLNNGAMLINHYNKTYTYPSILKDYSFSENFVAKLENINFYYSIRSEMDIVELYINGKFYTFQDAYSLGLIDIDLVWDIENLLDDFYILLDTEYPVDWGIIGDVDSDGKLSVLDATLIQKNVAKIVSFFQSEASLADFNNDGSVDILDATLIQKYVVGL